LASAVDSVVPAERRVDALALAAERVLLAGKQRAAAAVQRRDRVAGRRVPSALAYDFDALGVGAHLSYANDSIFIASSGARVFSLLVSLEILLPRDHGDHRRRRATAR